MVYLYDYSLCTKKELSTGYSRRLVMSAKKNLKNSLKFYVELMKGA